MNQRCFLRSASAAALAFIAAGPALADTLQEALLKAYQGNPTLTGARAEQRATDENVPIQKAAGRPAANATAEFDDIYVRPANSFNAPSRYAQGSANLSVPIYRGGAVKYGVKAAETRAAAGRAGLRGTESSIFSQAVAAYMNVIRDTAIVQLNQQNVHVLEVNLQATKDRFEVGDLTRTDVAQSESRLALARSDLQAAQARLIGSKESYIQLIGNPPGDLAPPPALPGLPDSPERAVEIALANNPDIEAAKKQREAARYSVSAARAAAKPTVSAFTSGQYTNYLGTLGSDVPGVAFTQTTKQAIAGVSASIPLYQGGRPAAQVRQAQAFESQALEGEIGTERSVIAQTRAAYASWQAALEVIDSSQKAVDAATLSLEGVRAENTVGSRTILDILNAEQELVNAKSQLVTARRDAYVAGFTLLAAVGQAGAGNLGLEGGALYDPMVNYNRVKGKWLDWGGDPKPTPVATRTVDSSTQNANVQPLTDN